MKKAKEFGCLGGGGKGGRSKGNRRQRQSASGLGYSPTLAEMN